MLTKSHSKVILLLISFLFALLPLYDFLVKGPFGWHIRQLAVVHGALELGLLSIIIYILLKSFHKIKKIASISIALLFFLYFRRHNIDIPFLITFIYTSSIYFLGSIFLKKLNIPYKFSFSFLTGIFVWVFISLFLSFFNLAKLNILLSFSLFVFFASLFFKKHSFIHALFFKIKHVYFSDKIKYPFYISIFILISLILLVQTAQNPSYDEFWYSLRGTEVLNQDGSFYEPILMLQHWVSFYPKLYEILIYPLEYFNTFTSSRMFSIFVLFFFMVAVYELLKTQIDTKSALITIFIIITIPAVSNTSIVAKPDLISSFIVFMGLLYFFKYSENKQVSYFILSLLLLIASLTTKLSVVPYTVLLGFIFVMYFFKNIKLVTYDLNKMHYLLYFLLIMTFLLVTYRTVSIVGIPFVSLSEGMSLISAIYEFLGFHYNPLYEKLNTVDSKTIFNLYELFTKYNFYPTETRLIFAWISSIYTVVFSLFFIYIIKNKPKFDTTKIVLLITIALFLFVLYVLFGKKMTPGGDGNYHLIPIITTLVLISLNQKIVNYYKFLVPIVVVNIVILFITNHGWSFGTNAFDLNFSKNPFNKEVVRSAKLKSVGAEDVFIELHKDDIRKKIIGFGPEQELFLLNATYESGPHIASQRSYLFESFETFKDMLKKTKTTHLLYPNYIPSNKFVEYSEALKACQGADVFNGKAYILLTINESLKNCINRQEKNQSHLITYTFREPKTITHVKYTSHLWMKSFQLTRDKYFPRNSLAIRNGTTIGYNNITLENNKNQTLSLKVMRHYLFNAKNDSGALEIIIRDEFDNSIKSKFKINNSEVISVELNLEKLKGNNYSFEFKNIEWENDSQIVLIGTSVVSK